MLLPKRADARCLGDYRPISLIHLVAKIFAKVLSLRLAPKLNALVSANQNAFIPGRSLHDNFVLVRQSARLLHQLKAPRLLLKLDLARAFNSISWPFLFEVLRQYGFGNRFLDWLAILLSSASTKVLLNGKPGPTIWHRCGFRQGDPLSPQLFVLAVDTLSRLLRRATETGILQQLHPRRPIPAVSLYADDVILFCHPTQGDTMAVKGVLQLFGRASGLQVNFLKSSATLIYCDADDVAPIIDALGCPIVDLPITYLGIPLAIKRPSAALLQPVVDKTAGMLPTWKARLMNKAGRLAFVQAGLSAIPIHQLLALAPPKRIIKALEKIQRGVPLGRTRRSQRRLNWRRVARPISLGGLGVHDLERTGLALRTRWLWLSRTDSARAWSGLDLQFSADERAFFFASTTMQIGNGQLALFWEDRWIDGRSVSEIAPALYSCIPKRRHKLRTVADGLQANSWGRDIQGTIGIQEIGEYLQLWHMIEHTTLSAEPDHLLWKWSSNGTYSPPARSRRRYTLASPRDAASCGRWRMAFRPTIGRATYRATLGFKRSVSTCNSGT
uniref:Reverse transcriptase domain-containing protein n=1 Tax=Triticum urartu TaxID=4572 RepID=A0A8R7R6Y0_TRIUA